MQWGPGCRGPYTEDRSLYGEVQCIMGNGHMGSLPVKRQTPLKNYLPFRLSRGNNTLPVLRISFKKIAFLCRTPRFIGNIK